MRRGSSDETSPVELTFACMFVPHGLFAAVADGATLNKLCQAADKIETTDNPAELVDVLQCRAYIAGVFTGYSMVTSALGLKEKGLENVCVPDEVKLHQIIPVVQKYLKAPPKSITGEPLN